MDLRRLHPEKVLLLKTVDCVEVVGTLLEESDSGEKREGGLGK
jgi:hypothetical protein